MIARMTTVALGLCLLLAPRAFAQDADAFLDAWHHAASVADEGAYFGAMTEDAVFIGTDAGERWLRDELRAWAKEYFARESAWVFEPVERHVAYSPDRRVAWFDEKLDSPHMGETRGSGVLVDVGGEWKIKHYVLSFAIPNGIADEVVAMVAGAAPENDAMDEQATVNGVRVGRWRAVIDSPGGQVPFDLMIEDEDGSMAAYYVNADEWIRVPLASKSDDGLIVFEMDIHDSQITCSLTPDGTGMRGQYTKRKGGFKWDRLAFHASFGDAPRFASEAPPEPTMEPAFAPIDGTWKVVFADDPDDPAIGVFETVEGNKVFGTFLTTVGDYRYIEGVYANGRLQLSVFDGAHCFLFDATVDTQGAMSGRFVSGEHYQTEFSATGSDGFELSDPFALSKWVGGDDLGKFSFPGPDGVVWSLDDERFDGKAKIVQVLGTWCPNCRDETRYLIDLHNAYASEGLSIIAISYEITPDESRNAEQVRTYIDGLGIPYPVLIAGGADGGNKRKAKRAVGFLDKVVAYPTTVFIDGSGKVRAVHTGFMGPATGEEHLKLRAEFEGLIEEMLGE